MRGCVLFAVLAAFGTAACVVPTPEPRDYRFVPPGDLQSPWLEKAADWQRRARAETGTALPVPEGETPEAGWLGEKVGEFEREEKRALVERVSVWAQLQARQHYRAEDDADPARDHWPTLAELIATNGDDCDGLDLIAFGILRSFGFDRDEVWRAVVQRDSDGVTHMVTLWFEPEGEPRVVDATGAATREVLPLSELHGWTPVLVFNESEQRLVVEPSRNGTR